MVRTVFYCASCGKACDPPVCDCGNGKAVDPELVKMTEELGKIGDQMKAEKEYHEKLGYRAPVTHGGENVGIQSMEFMQDGIVKEAVLFTKPSKIEELDC